MVPTYPTRQSHTQLTPRIPHKAKTIWLCTTTWRIRNGMGAGLDNDIVDMNENYINYINYNPKLVHEVDELAVAYTGTTGTLSDP